MLVVLQLYPLCLHGTIFADSLGATFLTFVSTRFLFAMAGKVCSSESDTVVVFVVVVVNNHHTSGRPHPMGACGTAVGTVLLQQLVTHSVATHKERDNVLLTFLEGLLSNPEPKLICKEISLCSCRLNAKKSAAILELQINQASILAPFQSVLRSYLEEMQGELLGPRPVGTLVRKARNQLL